MRTVADIAAAASERLLRLVVLVVYEDFGTGLRARRALDQTAQQLAVETDLRVNMWSFGLLRAPALHEQAANEAAEADIVFVSAHGLDEQPASLKVWVQRWLARKGGRPCTLVISLDADAGDSPSAIQMLEAWRTAARLAGVGFILHRGESQPEWEAALQVIQRPAETRTTVVDPQPYPA